jgi:hypothetical protein
LNHDQIHTDAAGAVMSSAPWRRRLTYLAMSAFVAFHTFVMVIMPNSSATGESLRALLRPYLSLLALEGTWTFFAPSVGKDSQFRYVVEDAAGREHTFVPLKDARWVLPSYYWIRGLHYAVIDDPDKFGGYFAAMACRQHASLKPISVMMVEVKEQDFRPENYLSGKGRFDPEFVIENPLKQIECRD